MAKSVYEFWLIWPNGTKSRLPVLPDSINISNDSQNESVNIAGVGEVTILQDPLAKSISFSSFFPAQESSFVEYPNPSKPWEFVERIEMFKESKKPIRFLVTGTPINMAVSIESFPLSESGGGVGDIYYDLTLKEYQFVSPRKIDTKGKVSIATSKRPDTKPKAKTHAVKPGDTLWAIAKKEYKNSNEWKKIWNANKDMLIKRDKRNVKQPGHWIFPGQVLILP